MIQIASVLSLILTRSGSPFLLKHIDVRGRQGVYLKSLVSVLRVYTADPCPEVVLAVVSSLPPFLDHFASHVHMVAESIVRMLVLPLSHRQRQIRYHSICVVLLSCCYCSVSEDSSRWTVTGTEFSSMKCSIGCWLFSLTVAVRTEWSVFSCASIAWRIDCTQRVAFLFWRRCRWIRMKMKRTRQSFTAFSSHLSFSLSRHYLFFEMNQPRAPKHSGWRIRGKQKSKRGWTDDM